MANNIFPDNPKPPKEFIASHLAEVQIIHLPNGKTQAIDLMALAQLVIANEHAIAELRTEVRGLRKLFDSFTSVIRTYTKQIMEMFER